MSRYSSIERRAIKENQTDQLGLILITAAQTALTYVSSDQCDLPQVDAALNRLNQAVPQIKKNVLNACAQIVAAGGVIQEVEAELLGAIADTLDCPIPPFLQPKEEATATTQ